MARKVNNDLVGRSIYVDNKGRAVYYSKREKRGYRIRNEDASKFKALESRYLYGILAFLVACFLFDLDIIISICLGLFVALTIEWRFRQFLKNCTIIEGYEPNGNPTLSFTTDDSYQKLGTNAILFIILGLLLMINAYFSPKISENIKMTLVSDVAGVLAILYGLKFLYIMYKKYRKEKQ